MNKYNFIDRCSTEKGYQKMCFAKEKAEHVSK